MAKIDHPNADELLYGGRAQVDALFMSLGEGVIVTDAKARINRINKAALKILGYTEKDLLGKWFPDAIITKDQNGNNLPSLDRPIGQVFLTGKSVSARAYYQRKDGRMIPVGLTVSPVMVKGKPIGAIQVFRDISYEVNLERAKDEFVAIASHQLRTPATAVRQYLSLLLEGYAEEPTEGQRLFLERAFESNERQLHIVEEILKITQLDLEKIVLKPEEHDVREVVNETIAGLKRNFEKKNQKLVVRLGKEPLKAKFDKTQLRIALENLLENASNYTWEGKNVTIIAKPSGKNNIKIAVKDEGVGIDPHDYTMLFKKFSRIANPLSVQTGGTGLGLYWAAKIIHLHGGYINVTSKVDEGSTFTIILPSGL